MEKEHREKVRRQVIYRCREVSLTRDSDGYTVTVEGECERHYTQVLEAWTNFIDTLDTRVRRRIREFQNTGGEAL